MAETNNDATPTEENATPKEEEKDTPEEAAPASSGRAKRVRKQTDAFQPTAEEAKTVEIPKGKGTPLKDMPNVVAHFSEVTWSDPHLKTLYNIVFGVGQRKNFKKHLLEFSGLSKEDPRVEAKVLKLQMAQLKGILDLVDVERGAESFEEKKQPTHQMLSERLMGWLEEPVESGRNKRKLKGATVKSGSSSKSKKKTEPKKRKAAPAKKQSSPAKKKKADIEIDIPGTTVDQLRAKIKSIVDGGDKEKMTVKSIRKELEDWLDVDDLTEHKDGIRMLVMEAMHG
ncbi:MAG: hypothetical protein SGILL_002128 [Bacillariaceae sp.]